MRGEGCGARLAGAPSLAACGAAPEGRPSAGGTAVTVGRVEGRVRAGTLFRDGLGADGRMVGDAAPQEITPVTLRVRAMDGAPLAEADRAVVLRDLPSCPGGGAIDGLEARREGAAVVLSFRCVRVLE